MSTKTRRPKPLAWLLQRQQPSNIRKGAIHDVDYIPYNGPYEPPKLESRTRKDSWGDPLPADELELDGFLDPELHNRYGQQQDSTWSTENGERRMRQRTHSAVSGRTVSSGTVDPAHHSTFSRRLVPSFVGGGVGESPMPTARPPRDTQRVSLGHIFNRKPIPLFTTTSLSRSSDEWNKSPVATVEDDYYNSFAHPYANPFSMPSTPNTAPLSSQPAPREIKNSISTPNLRATTRQPVAQPPKSKFKDKWLSAETWCDAILFPRPRFKVKDRQVSPPASPIYPGFQSNAVPSRVLAHSRSLVDLQQPSLHEKERALKIISPNRSRPRSFALDDLALPSPIPSLSKVLEDGQILDHQRKKWQMQAQNSFQNSRARNLSRSRTKSLTKQKQPDHEKLPAIDFLAARSLLGNQNVIPVADTKPARLRKHSLSKSVGTHSHSNSLSKTLSKSSKSESRGHSRGDSISKSALKMAKVICGVDDKADEKGLESALRDERTKVIRLADPALIQIDTGEITPTSSRHTVSPTPSGLSDSRVGIALSTPPPFVANEPAEAIRLFSHPYAQGGLYTYNGERAYAGPHPTTQLLSPDSARTDVQRHRLPPQALMHPYAQVSWRDSYQGVVPQLRPDSDVPAPAKMWAQFTPGVVREVLPHEIVYSPFMSENGSEAETPVTTQMPMDDATIVDTIGVGEALFHAVQRRSKDGDSGLGTSEDHTNEDQVSSFRVARKPVQYDLARSSLLPNKITSLDTIHSTHLTPPSNSRSGSDQSPGHSQQSSSPDSHDLLESPDDIEHFRDLFYRPNGTTIGSSTMSVVPSTPAPLVRNSSFPWERNRRTGSGLTSLARQLSEGFEEMNEEKADSHLHFVLSESTSLVDTSGDDTTMQDAIPAFQPSVNIPEDVQSSRASSVVQRSPVEDLNGLFRLGFVESATTPPATETDFRKSYTVLPEDEDTVVIRPHDSLAAPTLSLPSADPTRSSYLTSSTLSHMSGLSDFPVPPPRDVDLTPAHMSLLSSYFSEVSRKDEPSALPPDNSEDQKRRRFTFGRGDEIEELLASLSDHS